MDRLETEQEILDFYIAMKKKVAEDHGLSAGMERMFNKIILTFQQKTKQVDRELFKNFFQQLPVDESIHFMKEELREQVR